MAIDSGIHLHTFNTTAPGAYCTKCGIFETDAAQYASRPCIGMKPLGGPVGATKDTNPKDRAATSRLDLSLFPATARAYGALAFTEGDLKYGGYNWRVSGVKASVYYAACNRHLDKWFNGEDYDPSTGLPHLANALACIAVLIDASECAKLNDDRPPSCDMGGILIRMEADVKELQKLYPNGPERKTEEANADNKTV